MHLIRIGVDYGIATHIFLIESNTSLQETLTKKTVFFKCCSGVEDQVSESFNQRIYPTERIQADFAAYSGKSRSSTFKILRSSLHSDALFSMKGSEVIRLVCRTKFTRLFVKITGITEVYKANTFKIPSLQRQYLFFCNS